MANEWMDLVGIVAALTMSCHVMSCHQVKVFLLEDLASIADPRASSVHHSSEIIHPTVLEARLVHLGLNDLPSL